MKLIQFLRLQWQAATPIIARVLQLISLCITFAPTYYSTLPQEFKETIPANWLLGFSIGGFVIALGLQFTSKKQ